jgi:hypothetical protein
MRFVRLFSAACVGDYNAAVLETARCKLALRITSLRRGALLLQAEFDSSQEMALWWSATPGDGPKKVQNAIKHVRSRK